MLKDDDDDDDDDVVHLLTYGSTNFIITHRIIQNIGGISFFFLYLEKFLKRVFPPTPRRMANKGYKIFKYTITFTTIFVVIITANITKALYKKGIEIPIVGALPSGYAPAKAPAFGQWPAGLVIPAALPLAILGYMEAYSVGRKYALQFKYQISADQELFALGVGNFFASFFSSYPCSGKKKTFKV